MTWHGLAMRPLLLAAALTLIGAPALARENSYPIALPSQSLDASLFDLSRAMGLQLIFTDGAIARLRAPQLRGRFTARQALARLLEGSGYSYRLTNADTVRIYKCERSGHRRTSPGSRSS